nr:MAG TPA: hypothetical protein [Caudoviricetes sp.]
MRLGTQKSESKWPTTQKSRFRDFVTSFTPEMSLFWLAESLDIPRNCQ